MKNEVLKGFKKSLEERNYILNEDIRELLDLRDRYDLYYCDDIIDTYTLEEMTKEELESGGIERLYYFLPSEKDGNPYAYNEYFMIDGYGNARVIDVDDILCILSDNIDMEEN